MQTENTAKALIIERLRQEGCRITYQREQILDVILEGDCATIKEICNRSRKLDRNIGFATVYRMVSLLEQVGLVSRGIMINYDWLEELENT